MHTMLKFRCPSCDVGLEAKEEKAGRNYGCPNCEATVTVPVQQALVPVTHPVIVPEVIPDWERRRKLARRKKRRERDDSRPVELKLPGPLGHMKVDVDKKTRNTMACTFLGGLLVAVGAFLCSMLLGKSKSS